MPQPEKRPEEVGKTVFLRCPDCGKTEYYCSLDLDPECWNDAEEFTFSCKACGAELKLEIEYDFRFFESIDWECDTENCAGDINDIIRWTPEEAKAQYDREHAPKRGLFSASGLFAAPENRGLFAAPESKGLFSLPESKGLFAAPEKKGLFSLPAKGLFSLNRRKR